MNEPIKEQMYIIAASCWKCKKDMNVAIIESNDNKRKGSICGPEVFSSEEIKIAENHNVLIKEHHSYTREESYYANTCPSCNTFIGQFYLFTSYFVPAVQYGDYEYKIIEIS